MNLSIKSCDVPGPGGRRVDAPILSNLQRANGTALAAGREGVFPLKTRVGAASRAHLSCAGVNGAPPAAVILDP
jgi:hypothetical protein